jgi:hypothetical protein
MYFDKYRVKLIASTPISMITGDTSILFLDVLAERFDKDLSEQEQQSNARSSEDYQFIQLKARFDKEFVDSVIYLTDNDGNADILSCRYGEVEENNTNDSKEAHLHSVARAIVQFTFFPLLQNKYGFTDKQSLVESLNTDDSTEVAKEYLHLLEEVRSFVYKAAGPVGFF